MRIIKFFKQAKGVALTSDLSSFSSPFYMEIFNAYCRHNDENLGHSNELPKRAGLS